MFAQADWLPRLGSIATFATLALAMSLVSHATTDDTIRVWKIGSPHTGDVPNVALPFTLSQESSKRGIQMTVEAFPAKGFAATFAEAVTRGETPDVLVFNNFGVMDGITTGLGKFEGIGEDPGLRKHLIRVTGAFDNLRGPDGGWTYLFALSANHSAARTLALRAPECVNGSSGPTFHQELVEIVPKVATAYLNGDAISLQPYRDAERSSTMRPIREPVSTGAVRLCGLWGNDKLAFASVTASYDAQTTIGTSRVLLVFRKPSFQWQLLVAARDPISTDSFMKAVPSLTALLANNGQTRVFPVPATLLSPAPGVFPQPSHDQRFGTFTWLSSASDDVVAEIAEFAYHDDARLFFKRPARAQSAGQISVGQLWSTGGEWNWRIWSVSRAGDIAFSEARNFRH